MVLVDPRGWRSIIRKSKWKYSVADNVGAFKHALCRCWKTIYGVNMFSLTEHFEIVKSVWIRVNSLLKLRLLIVGVSSLRILTDSGCTPSVFIRQGYIIRL